MCIAPTPSNALPPSVTILLSPKLDNFSPTKMVTSSSGDLADLTSESILSYS